MRHETIYALVDPRDGKPFYVGRTIDASPRLNAHRTDQTGSRKADHIRAMAAAGVEPEMTVLDRVPPSQAKESEVVWIRRLQEQGIALTNNLRVVGLEKKDDRRGMTLRLNDAAWRQLKSLAIDEGRPAHDILIDSLNDYFRKKGLSPLAD